MNLTWYIGDDDVEDYSEDYVNVISAYVVEVVDCVDDSLAVNDVDSVVVNSFHHLPSILVVAFFPSSATFDALIVVLALAIIRERQLSPDHQFVLRPCVS